MWLNFLAIFTKCLVRVTAYFKGIKIGSNSKFWGITTFVRYPNSIIKIGSDCKFRSSSKSNLIGVAKPCILSTHSSNACIIIGNNCGFSGTTIGAYDSILIGNNVLFGANTVVTDFDWHNIDPLKRSLPVRSGKPVTIEDNVFIGYGVIILKGVNVGVNSVIGAGSVVTNDIPPNCIAAGNPCKVISALEYE